MCHPCLPDLLDVAVETQHKIIPEQKKIFI